MKNEVIKNKVFKSLDVIYEVSIITSHDWEKKSLAIPLDLFYKIIRLAKWKRNTKNKIALHYIDDYNKMIQLMYESAENISKNFSSNSVSLLFIDETIKMLKKSFLKGYDTM